MMPCNCPAPRIVRGRIPARGDVVVECSQCGSKWVGVQRDGLLEVAPPDAVAVEAD